MTECHALSTVGFVPLTRGYVAIVDASDLASVGEFSWYAFVSPRTGIVYARTGVPLSRIKDIGDTNVSMHRLIVKTDAYAVDHINGNGLDNRRKNLRPATQSQNLRNSRKPRSRRSDGLEPSRYKGVKAVVRGGRIICWYAVILVNRRPVHLGSFKTQEEAARRFDFAAREVCGEFARLNFPDDEPVMPTTQAWLNTYRTMACQGV